MNQRQLSLDGPSVWNKRHVKYLLQFRIEDLPRSLASVIEISGGCEIVLRRFLERPMSPEQERVLSMFINYPGYPTNFYVEKIGIHPVSYSRLLGKLITKLLGFLNDGAIEFMPKNQLSALKPKMTDPSKIVLPATWTSFIGREQILDSLEDILHNNLIRLITLTGPGGTGKTRLSIQVAKSIQGVFSDGIYFIPLAPVQNDELIVSTIIHGLGITINSKYSLIQQLKLYFAHKSILLILDNFEHLIEGAPLVTELLAAAPQLKIMVTSRERLHLYGEYEVVIPPMILPLEHPDLMDETTLNNEAVQLFTQRAKNTADFNLDQTTATTVAKICQALEGIPLAIELVAARVKGFPLEAILPRLTNQLDFVIDGPRDLPPRQRTLRGAIDWSYQLLNEQEQQILVRLAIFAGGCPLEAAAVVCEVNNSDAKSSLQSLINKSLIQCDNAANESKRYSMLESIREYGLERLAQNGLLEGIWNIYGDYYKSIVADAEPKLRGVRSLEYLNRLDSELANIRAVLSHSVGNNNPLKALSIVTDLWMFWIQRSYIREGRTWFETIFKQGIAYIPAGLEEQSLFVAGSLAINDLDFDAGWDFLQKALPIARKHNNFPIIALSLRNLGKIATQNRDYPMADALLNESYGIFQELNDSNEIAWTNNALATLAWRKGDLHKALRLYKQSLAIFKTTQDMFGISLSFLLTGAVHYHQAQYPQAKTAFKEALGLARKQDDKVSVAWLLQFLGYTAYHQHDFDKMSLFEDALLIYKVLDRRSDIASCFVGLVGMLWGNEQFDQAIFMLGVAESALDHYPNSELPLTQTQYDRLVKVLWNSAPSPTATTLWTEGHHMSFENALDYALDILHTWRTTKK